MSNGRESLKEMKRWQALEIEYAERLRASNRDERRSLYEEAYRVVSAGWSSEMPKAPEERTAGTSPSLVNSLVRLCDSTDHVLEVGCGRGYTCLKPAPHVASMVGLDVSDPALGEARKLLKANQVGNVCILKGSADELTRLFDEGTLDRVISRDAASRQLSAWNLCRGGFDVDY